MLHKVRICVLGLRFSFVHYLQCSHKNMSPESVGFIAVFSNLSMHVRRRNGELCFYFCLKQEILLLFSAHGRFKACFVGLRSRNKNHVSPEALFIPLKRKPLWLGSSAQDIMSTAIKPRHHCTASKAITTRMGNTQVSKYAQKSIGPSTI